jgi:uncharacterized membrane protein YfcA
MWGPDSLVAYLVICAVAFLASGLTFFSGFGLGTLLLPVFALFFPIESAIAFTAVVHLLNNLFKLALVGRHADRRVVFRFGLPAIVAAFFGAALLVWLARLEPVHSYSIGSRQFEVTAIKLVVGVLLLTFALMEVVPRFRNLQFPPRYLPLGGLLSGFFGGLTGMQGALRSAFLIRAGLTKEAFIATGVVVACLVDVSRLALYSRSMFPREVQMNYALVTAAVVAASAGALLGSWYLKKVTMRSIQWIVTVMLVLVALGLVVGLL